MTEEEMRNPPLKPAALPKKKIIQIAVGNRKVGEIEMPRLFALTLTNDVYWIDDFTGGPWQKLPSIP